LFISGTRGGEFRFDLRPVLAQSGEEGLLLALGGCQLDSARLLERADKLSPALAFLGRSGGCLGFAPRIASAIAVAGSLDPAGLPPSGSPPAGTQGRRSGAH